MLFTDIFIASINENPIARTIDICTITQKNLNEDPNCLEWFPEEYDILTEAYALISEIKSLEIITLSTQVPILSGNWQADCSTILNFVRSVQDECNVEHTKLRVESLQKHFRTNLGKGFSYEFTQGDLNRIQELINELRSQIAESSFFDSDHQRRLLTRLEKLQSELHKKISDLDRFWGLIGDAGVALGKFGNDAKPLIDRIVEISNIVWRTQARAEELSSDTPFPLLEKTKNKIEK